MHAQRRSISWQLRLSVKSNDIKDKGKNNNDAEYEGENIDEVEPTDNHPPGDHNILKGTDLQLNNLLGENHILPGEDMYELIEEMFGAVELIFDIFVLSVPPFEKGNIFLDPLNLILNLKNSIDDLTGISDVMALGADLLG